MHLAVAPVGSVLLAVVVGADFVAVVLLAMAVEGAGAAAGVAAGAGAAAVVEAAAGLDFCTPP